MSFYPIPQHTLLRRTSSYQRLRDQPDQGLFERLCSQQRRRELQNLAIGDGKTGKRVSQPLPGGQEGA
jgi:hypothetical protein